MWPLKKNFIHQGDCIKLLGKIDQHSVDLVFADPPFNIGYEYDVYDDAKESDDYLSWCRQWISGVYRVLKNDGTFWLAIGDEYAAELKIEAQQAGFHCRSWVIWYYTFGVNCRNGFSRSHTHLFHFTKNKSKFTFNRPNPQIRVKSARQLVYADNRANPDGRLPDNTWITRPQDAPMSFSPLHDTWFFARVAGTFKEREGFHGCQMPEQLLARIIRSSSHPQDLVLDPFCGSGTTVSVAKKLGRQWMGLELSSDYVKFINQRLDSTSIGDSIDGPEDPIQSAPSTANGKRRKKPFDQKTEKAVIESYEKTAQGYPSDYLLCDKELNKSFIDECLKRGIGGNAYVWNHYMMNLRKAKKLPKSTKRPERITASELDHYGYASEVAWRLISIDFRKSLDEILCSPDFAEYFDQLARQYGPNDDKLLSTDYRRAAISIRKRAKSARTAADLIYESWSKDKPKVVPTEQRLGPAFETPGVFCLMKEQAGIYACESTNIRAQVDALLEIPKWQDLEADSVAIWKLDSRFKDFYALKSAVIRKMRPMLNCEIWVSNSELPA